MAEARGRRRAPAAAPTRGHGRESLRSEHPKSERRLRTQTYPIRVFKINSIIKGPISHM